MKFYIIVLSVLILNAAVQAEFDHKLHLISKRKPPAPWWCNAAVTKCNGGEDPCCFGFWANPKDACRAACAQCGRSC